MDMIHALISGFVMCFTWSTFSLMLIGIAIGFVVGILPGLGGPTAMALMLPFVFKMSAVEAFAFLLGMTAVTATTGDITSVRISRSEARMAHLRKGRGVRAVSVHETAGDGKCRRPFEMRTECRGQDLNLHPLARTSTSSWRVCQFRHPGIA